LVRFPLALSPVDVFLAAAAASEHAFILESMTGTGELGRCSFVGFRPSLLVSAKDGMMEIKDADGGRVTLEVDDPLRMVKAILGERRAQGPFRFIGGAVGYISYDSIRYWETVPSIATDDLGFPDLEMGIYGDCVIFDHSDSRAYYSFADRNRLGELLGILEEDRVSPTGLSHTQPKPNVGRDRFQEMVVGAKEYIASGDIFQVVLSKRYDFEVEGDLSAFYLALRRINPSPYMYFVKQGGRQIVGSSPEMLVRVTDDLVETFPIAGTTPRGKGPDEDGKLATQLLADPKERAEHVMLLDLARNDVGRVSRYGSVEVPEFMKVHRYSHVQHIVSRVTGRLRAGFDSFDALRCLFPAGTVSGAPKVRAMEIIEEFEPTRRGPYAGAVGYFSLNGNADFAITIRTLVADGNRCHVQVGSGIVADSRPEKEWLETESKVRALMRALEVSEGCV